ncbi:unnamed protein product [Merluccius merluccius]
MASRLAFQTQLASIMEVLANAAVAEICKLVDDDYAVVSLQMSQCQRENKALKRKLHLMELKMARGFAERRLRESAAAAAAGGRARVHVGVSSDRFRSSSSSSTASEELCTTISVHGGAPDTITPAKDSTSNQPRQDGSDTLASECSVLDLEAFFTRWTPDSGAPPAAPPSCSFSTEELLEEEEEEEEVVLVEEGHQPPRRRAGAASSQRSSRIHTNHSPSPGTSLSASPRIQAPPPQLTWSRAAAMMRNAQTQSLQHGRHGNRAAHRVLHSAQNSIPTTANANAGTRMRRLANFHSFPPAGLPARGSDGKGLGSDSSGLGGVSTRLGGGTRRRNYACRACGKAFSGLSNLEAHQRVHTGEKPFSCSTCGKRFSEAGNLKKHQRVHTGDKPYGCQRCGKRFAWVCNLRTHQQSGTGCGSGPVLGDPDQLEQ